jgi:hypothetical protein
LAGEKKFRKERNLNVKCSLKRYLMPGQYDGLFVEFSLVCQKEENEKSTKKHCFGILSISKNSLFLRMKKRDKTSFGT